MGGQGLDIWSLKFPDFCSKRRETETPVQIPVTRALNQLFGQMGQILDIKKYLARNSTHQGLNYHTGWKMKVLEVSVPHIGPGVAGMFVKSAWKPEVLRTLPTALLGCRSSEAQGPNPAERRDQQGLRPSTLWSGQVLQGKQSLCPVIYCLQRWNGSSGSILNIFTI